MKKITDADFKYTPSHETDIGKRFRKVRAEQKAKAEKDARNAAEAESKTLHLPSKRAA